MKTLKIPIHSMIDLITNSSTEIFVTSDSSVKPAKELLTELLKINGSDKTCDEVFTLTVEVDNERLADFLADQMEEYDEELWNKLGLEDASWQETDNIISKYLEDIEKGEIERPEWISTMIEDMEISIDTYLVVKSNDPKYDNFLELLKTFLYSPDYNETYN